jgi:predicted component of type VI protein secretion system
VSGRYKAISELRGVNGTGFPITRIKEIFPDLETQGRPLERAGLAVLRDGLKDVTRAVEAASSEITEQATTDVSASINRLPKNIVGVPTARYQNFLRQLRSYETVLSRFAAQRADHLSKAAELERTYAQPNTAEIQQTSSTMQRPWRTSLKRYD